MAAHIMFFNMCIRICVNDILSNLHLVAIPMFEQHTIENIFNLIARFLDALSSTTTIWHAKLMSMSIDGENNMTGCHHGVVTHLEQATKFPMLHIWCVSHEIDIVIKNAIALPQHGQWIKVVYKWCLYMRRQEKFIMDMNGEMCPKKTNQCTHVDDTFKFYISCRRKIIEHTDAHVHFELSSTKWWTITFIVVLAIIKINKTIV
jgi:hypothetical protein